MTIYDNMERLLRDVKRLQDGWEADDYLLACRALGNITEVFSDLAADFAQLAYDNGATKKTIAAALNVRPSDLRGMERRVSA